LKKLLLGGLALLAFAGAGGSSAFAISAGCSAVNGGALNLTLSTPPNTVSVVVGGFSAGDHISYTAQGLATALTGIGDVTTTLLIVSGTSGSFTVSSAQATHSFQTQLFGTGAATLTVTCTPAASSSGASSSDSQYLRALQVAVTKTVAANSGAAITGAVDGAIGDAFSSTGGAPITVGPNGFAMNFAAEPPSQISSRTDDAFSALGYAGNVYKAPPRLYDHDWSAWADVRGTGFDQNNAQSDMHGDQLNVTGGVGRKLTPDFLVGIFTGYEHFNFSVESLGGKMSGDGGTVGTYAAYHFDPHWRADGVIGWSDVWYTGTANTASGSFNGSRWLGSLGLTGDYRYAALVLEPSTRIYTLWESENAFTDSLGTLQASRNFSESRVSTGGKVIYPMQPSGGIQISPYVGLYGDYRFSTDNALPVGVPFVGIQDGWSGRATTGVTFATSQGGPSLSLGGELGGIGAGYDVWSANARVNWPF
jgi:hypothetical protein